MLVVLVIGGWGVDTTYLNQPVVLDRVLTLAATLYVGHSLTALAAVLPLDAAVRFDVVTRWLVRAAGVVLACPEVMPVRSSGQRHGATLLACEQRRNQQAVSHHVLVVDGRQCEVARKVQHSRAERRRSRPAN